MLEIDGTNRTKRNVALFDQQMVQLVRGSAGAVTPLLLNISAVTYTSLLPASASSIAVAMHAESLFPALRYCTRAFNTMHHTYMGRWARSHAENRSGFSAQAC